MRKLPRLGKLENGRETRGMRIHFWILLFSLSSPVRRKPPAQGGYFRKELVDVTERFPYEDDAVAWQSCPRIKYLKNVLLDHNPETRIQKKIFFFLFSSSPNSKTVCFILIPACYFLSVNQKKKLKEKRKKDRQRVRKGERKRKKEKKKDRKKERNSLSKKG